ncbi:polyadenylate-binding protein 1-like [Clarias gariepinus]|uniref:polyadenylate-binding protein 1-like n=1 Tax=Clarias gariepinus TaxID=13013 RepID=UPI00234DF955|nr:polyadenylate-binding protein 1-like [Clarias gariepinus]
MNTEIMLSVLYVGNLHPGVTASMLWEKFNPAGCIHSLKLCRYRRTSASRQYAYINFYQPAEAECAIQMLNSEQLMGRPMRVMWSHKGSKRSGHVNLESVNATEGTIRTPDSKLFTDPENTDDEKLTDTLQPETAHSPDTFTNIFIKNFGQDMDDEMLAEIFNSFGPTVSVRVMTDENGKSKGFGFVSFERHEDAQRAMKVMNGKEVNGRKIYVGRAQSKIEREAEIEHIYRQGLNLYVKHLDDNVDDEALRGMFSPFGTITSAKVMMLYGQSRGFGFVHFSSFKEGMNAIKNMNHKMLGKKPLYVCVAQRKEDRHAFLAQQHNKGYLQL